MKKSLASQLRKIAAELPEKWEKEYEIVQMTGKEANLCTKGRPFDENKIVEFRCPRFIQVNHYRQLKEGIKKMGLRFVGLYLSRF